MRVIFLKSVAGVANTDEVKEVSSGYARNFLIPRGLATVATPELIAQAEAKKAKRDAEMEAKREEYTKLAEKLSGSEVEIPAKANDKGALFAGIDGEMISKAITEQLKTSVLSDQVVIEKPIKDVGEHEIAVVFLKDITVPVKVKVVAESNKK